MARTIPALLDASSSTTYSLALTAPDGRWLTYAQLREQTLETAAALDAIGITRRDTIATVGDDRMNMTLADLAIAHTGAASMPLSDSCANKMYSLWRAGTAAAFVQDVETARQLRGVVQTIVCFDPTCPTERGPGAVWNYRDFRGHGRDAGGSERYSRVKSIAQRIDPSDLARVVYAQDNILMLTHGNIAAAADSLQERLGVRCSDKILLSLQTDELLATTMAYLALNNCAEIVASEQKTFTEDILSTKPTIAITTAQNWMRIHDNASNFLSGAGGLSPIISRLAHAGAVAHAKAARSAMRSDGMKKTLMQIAAGLTYPAAQIADALLLLPTREHCGGKLRHAITTGTIDAAPLYLAQGIPLRACITQQEVCGAIALGDPGDADAPRGMLMSGLEARVVDGKVLLRGPQVFAGYLDDPARTAAAFSTAHDAPFYDTGREGRTEGDTIRFS